MITMNVNDYVQVRLTELGRKIHRENYDSLNAEYGGKLPMNYEAPKEGAEGWSSWQLWHLMEEFGKHMGNGRELVFETTIRIDEP